MTTTNRTPLESIIQQIECAIDFARIQLSEFKDSLDKDEAEYAYTLEWSGTTFKNAAKLEVFTKARGSISAIIDRFPGCGEDEVIRRLTLVVNDRLLQGARCPSFSTSVPGNLVDTYRTVAWAELSETIKWNTQNTEAV